MSTEREFLWVPAERVTEPLYAPTLEMEVLAAWRTFSTRENDWKCTRCRNPVEGLSTGHYFSTCRVTGQQEAFHFCCPGNCELHLPEAGALHGTRPEQT